MALCFQLCYSPAAPAESLAVSLRRDAQVPDAILSLERATAAPKSGGGISTTTPASSVTVSTLTSAARSVSGAATASSGGPRRDQGPGPFGGAPPNASGTTFGQGSGASGVGSSLPSFARIGTKLGSTALLPTVRPAITKGRGEVQQRVTVWMSLGRLYHKLSYDRAQRMATITRYTRPTRAGAGGLSLPYRYLLSTETTRTWMARQVECNVTALRQYHWSTVDDLLSQPLDRVFDAREVELLRFWRTRMALIPCTARATASAFLSLLEDINRVLRPRETDREDVQRGRGDAALVSASPPTGLLGKMLEVSVGDAAVSTPILTKQVFVDIDPRRLSDRDEWGVLLYDSHYHEKRCFHFEMQWIVATGCLVRELVERMMTRADSFGFRLVPIPIAQSASVDEIRRPFHLPLLISIVSPVEGAPWRTAVGAGLSLSQAILTSYGFLENMHVDHAPVGVTLAPHDNATEYVHLSGLCFLRVVSDPPGFAWATNQTYSGPGRAGKRERNVDGSDGVSGEEADPKRALLQHLCELCGYVTNTCVSCAGTLRTPV